MPFKSSKQRKYLWSNKPELARKWTAKYGSKPKKMRKKNALQPSPKTTRRPSQRR